MTRVIVEDFAGPGGWDEGAQLIGLSGIVGNAMPPLLAAAILGHLLDVDGWQDVCRDWYAREDGAA